MPKFQLNFVGRQVGAIGIYHQITETIEVAEDQAAFFRGLTGINIDGNRARLSEAEMQQILALHDRPEVIKLYEKWEHISFARGHIAPVTYNTKFVRDETGLRVWEAVNPSWPLCRELTETC